MVPTFPQLSPSPSVTTSTLHALHRSFDVHQPPSITEVQLAIRDLNLLLHPPHNRGCGYKTTALTSTLEKCLMWMLYFFRAFVNGLEWGPAALKTAKFVGKGPYISRKVREWSRAYIADRGNLPFIRYSGAWTKSRIRDEDLQEELLLHLQSLGKYVTASAIIIYLDHLEVQARYGLTKNISLATAQRWMTEVGYRWGKDPKGQYVDGHE
ncbi:hypothetical protein PAXRUDRAFT_179983, partial [Paxillus rubicundulus Ve08.2h10]